MLKADYFHLTKREQEVLELIAKGYTNSEIAEKMVIQKVSVRCHIAEIYGKLGLYAKCNGEYSTMRLKAALYYYKQKGILQEDN